MPKKMSPACVRAAGNAATIDLREENTCPGHKYVHGFIFNLNRNYILTFFLDYNCHTYRILRHLFILGALTVLC